MLCMKRVSCMRRVWGCIKHVHVYYLGGLRRESSDDLVASDEGEKVNAEIRKNISHRPVGFCRATNHFSWNPWEEQRCRQHCRLHLPVHLDMDTKRAPSEQNIYTVGQSSLTQWQLTQHINAITAVPVLVFILLYVYLTDAFIQY